MAYYIIQRRYGLDHKRFALFNTVRWNAETKPDCCEVVPVLYEGIFNTEIVNSCVRLLGEEGSKAVEGYMKPEGVVVYHKASNHLFKVTVENDEKPKGI